MKRTAMRGRRWADLFDARRIERRMAEARLAFDVRCFERQMELAQQIAAAQIESMRVVTMALAQQNAVLVAAGAIDDVGESSEPPPEPGLH